MATPHVVSALQEKRAEVSGVIADLERRIARHRVDLVHVDAVLRLYVADLDPEEITPKAVRRRNEWFKPGELSRLVLDVLRVAPAAMAVKDIAAEVMVRRGLDPADERMALLVRKQVNNAVTRQASGLVEKVVDGQSVTWQVRR